MKTHPHVSIGLTCWIGDNSELPELERCLNSLVDFYPVIVVNGKWDDIEGKNARSTPEANELIESYSNVIHFSSPNKPEFHNRNECLINAGKFLCDYLIFVDSDEYIEMPLGKEFFLNGLNDVFEGKTELCSYAHYFDIGRGGNARMHRIIRYPMFVRMRNRHNEWFFNKIDIRKRPLKAPRGLVIHSDKSFRKKERHEAMKKRNMENPLH